MSVFTVTGGTGYIGSKLVQHLVDEGHFVYAAVREESKLTQGLENSDNVSVFIYNEECDLEDPIANSDFLIHLGALYTVAEDERATEDLIESNILFSTRIFNVAKRINPKIVIASASTFSSLDEEGLYAPASLYAATKSAVEVIAEYYTELSIHFLTFPDTYGPDDWRNKIHNIVLRNESWPFQFRSSSTQEMRMLHIEDVIGHLLASLNDNSKGVTIHDIYEEGVLINLKELSELLTDEECLFNEESEVVKIPEKAREISKPTGYSNKYPSVSFSWK